MIKKNDVKNLAKSFTYAFHGIAYSIKNERNMRIHISAVVLILFFSYYYGLNRNQYCILLLCFGFVICAEVFNTAIEALVNLESPAYHHFARIAKDVAAGAVAVSAFISSIIGIIIYFLNFKHLLNTFIVIFKNPISGIVFLFLIILSILFIFNGPKLFRKTVADVNNMSNFNEIYEDKSIE